MNQRRIIGLDVIRSNAILFVLACHAILQYSRSRTQEAVAVGLGIFGVEQFFVLSGFLIGSILIRDFSTRGVTFLTLRTFWSRRWYRTLPNYYLYLLLTILIAAPWHHHIGRLAEYPFFLQNFAWEMPNFFNISWSLCIEEWFYLLFPLSVFFAFSCFKNAKKSILLTILLFLIFPLILRLFISGSRNWFGVVQQTVIYRLDAIALGVVLAYVKRQNSLWRLFCSFYTLLSGLILGCVLFVYLVRSGYCNGHGGIHSGIANALSFLGVDISFALILPWFSLVTTMGAPWNFFFSWLSVLSYSLYLSNRTVVKPLGAIWDRFPAGAPSFFITFPAWLFGIFVLACLSYFLVERPFLLFRDRRVLKEKQAAGFVDDKLIFVDRSDG